MEKIKENFKTMAKEGLGQYEMKQRKPCFNGKCLGFLGHRKQAKMQWLQDPNQSNVDNLNNIIYKASRHFRNKKNI